MKRLQALERWAARRRWQIVLILHDRGGWHGRVEDAGNGGALIYIGSDEQPTLEALGNSLFSAAARYAIQDKKQKSDAAKFRLEVSR